MVTLSLLIGSMPAVASESALCRQAERRDTQRAWTRVIERVPGTLCAQVAQARLDQLSADTRACSEARREGTLAAWARYSQAYPTGECGLNAVTEIKMREARGEVVPELGAAEGVDVPSAEVDIVSVEGGFDVATTQLVFGTDHGALLTCAGDGAATEVSLRLTVANGVVAGERLGQRQGQTDAGVLQVACLLERLSTLDWPTADVPTTVSVVVQYR